MLRQETPRIPTEEHKTMKCVARRPTLPMFGYSHFLSPVLESPTGCAGKRSPPHRADQRHSDGKRPGGLPAGGVADALQYVERIGEGGVVGRRRRLLDRRQGGRRDKRGVGPGYRSGAGGVHLAWSAPHRPVPVSTVPSSMVEARRRRCAQSSRSLRR